jgi:hypothetical protein
MLLNFSNHPFSTWTESQINAAVDQFKHVVDLRFPDVSPNANPPDILELAESYVDEIIGLSPQAVHVMGEHCLVFAVVRLLQKANIPALASTSLRNVQYEENGSKVVTFNFIQFRPYPVL